MVVLTFQLLFRKKLFIHIYYPFVILFIFNFVLNFAHCVCVYYNYTDCRAFILRRISYFSIHLCSLLSFLRLYFYKIYKLHRLSHFRLTVDCSTVSDSTIELCRHIQYHVYLPNEFRNVSIILSVVKTL